MGATKQRATMIHQLIFSKLLGEIDYGAMGDFSPAGFNQADIWSWNAHSPDWIYEGGPDSDGVKHDVYFNQWEDLDDSPIGWHITEPVDPCETDGWLSTIGGGIY